MKKISYISLISIALLAMSCAEDFLDTKNLYQKSDESYYKTPADIEEALTGAYAAVPLDAGNNNPIIVSELMSDDRLGGGGSNDDGFHGTDAFTLPPDADYYMNQFETGWQGILRVNLILKRFDQAEYLDLAARDQAHGEAYFLRAFFYFRLSQFFGPVPLKLDPAPGNFPRATPEDMYGQIALDLITAIDLMPGTPYGSIPSERWGHATKWAAEALLARVFLFYTGYYEKTEIELADGGTLTKSDVIAYLDDLINNSGHRLLSDFRNNWTYSAVQRYAYTANNGLDWADDDPGGNPEKIWSIKYGVHGGWNPPDQQLSYSNQNVLYSGLRQQEHLPFGAGWGSGPVTPQFYESFEPNDLRKDGSVLNVNKDDGSTIYPSTPNPDEGPILDDYIWGSDNQMHETGLWSKKYLPVYDSVPGETRIASIFFISEGTPDNMQLWDMQDDILIRYADVLLMAAELKGPGAGDAHLNAVRSRAGLPDATASLENIQRERRHELMGEGFRYFDLLRWSGQDLDYAISAFNAATNFNVLNVGEEATYTVNFRPETGGFLPIPRTEILLSEGVLEQTPGWE